MKSRLTRIALAATLVLSAPAFAQDALAQIKAAGVLKIGTEGTYAPFTYHLPSGELTGFDVEIAQAVAKKLGVKAQFVEGKWDGLIAGLDVNRYDVVVNEVTITDARKAKYDFSQPYILSKPVLIVASNNSSIKSFADLKGKKSAHTLSSNFAKQAQSYGAEVVGTDGFEQSVALVLTGRADATINDSLSFLDFKKKKPDAQVKVVATSKDTEASGILLRKGNPELLAAINKALAELKQDGSYLKLSQKYFGEDVSQ